MQWRITILALSAEFYCPTGSPLTTESAAKMVGAWLREEETNDIPPNRVFYSVSSRRSGYIQLYIPFAKSRREYRTRFDPISCDLPEIQDTLHMPSERARLHTFVFALSEKQLRPMYDQARGESYRLQQVIRDKLGVTIDWGIDYVEDLVEDPEPIWIPSRNLSYAQ